MKPAIPEHLTHVLTTDYSGVTRGRAMSRGLFDKAKGKKSFGWVPANMSLTPFDLIADPNPWGSRGDLRLVSDPQARFTCWPAKSATPLDMVMGNLTELDGKPWALCARNFLKQALADFKAETGADFICTFEQEFKVLGAAWPKASSFGLSALRRADPFGPDVVAALTQAGVPPEIFVAEYGADQFELTTSPVNGMEAADRAVVVREVVKEIARLHGWRASFAPKTEVAGVGNGVHIHFSFSNAQAFDTRAKGRMSKLMQQFCAGVLMHLPALIAFTCPSPISGLRLRPHNWSSSYVWLGEQDRESSLRICPSTSPQNYNVEFRACDACAAPHLALAVLVRAGLEGIRARLPAPDIIEGEPDGLQRLPGDLPSALDALEQDSQVKSWFSPEALETYLGMKRMELKLCHGLEGDALCARYAEIY